jgi:hypothetical protein
MTGNFFPEFLFLLELTWEGTLEFVAPTVSGAMELNLAFIAVIAAQVQSHRRIECFKFGSHVQLRIQLVEQPARLETGGDRRTDGETKLTHFGFARVSGGATAGVNVTLENTDFQTLVGEQRGGGQASETRADHGCIGL